MHRSMDREEDQVQLRQVKKLAQNEMPASWPLYDHLQSGRLASESVTPAEIKMAPEDIDARCSATTNTHLRRRRPLPAPEPHKQADGQQESKPAREVISSRIIVAGRCSLAKHRHNMLPSWRQIAMLCLLSILLTSLLASLNVFRPSTGSSSCLQCHALTIDSSPRQPVSSSTSPAATPADQVTSSSNLITETRNSWLPTPVLKGLELAQATPSTVPVSGQPNDFNHTTSHQQVKSKETNNGQLIPAASQASKPSIIRATANRFGSFSAATSFDQDELQHGTERLVKKQPVANSSSPDSSAVPSKQSSIAIKLLASPSLVNTSQAAFARPHWSVSRDDPTPLTAHRGRLIKTSPRAALSRQVSLPQIIIGRPIERLQASDSPIKFHLARAQQFVHGSPSASAPSIALPPLSHLLSPRNPFRLFASASPSRLMPQLFMQSSNRLTRYQPHKQPQTEATNQLVSGLLSMPPPNLDGAAHVTAGRLYAHSHSAEQLEQLVRAASQATGIKSPILPAIVSAPTGPFPGFYIPALESEPETRPGPLSYGSADDSAFSASSLSASASTSGQDYADSISSKIPGTDYVLHPDEVRAMMNIGEMAWRKQLENQQKIESHQAAASNELKRPGLMQENHLENARDFAYVDRIVSPGERLVGSSSSQAQVNNSSPAEQTSGYEALESQLSSQLRQHGISSLPAIIRVNNQDYIHWPLLQQPRQASSPQESRQNSYQMAAGQEVKYETASLPRERLPRSQLYTISAFNRPVTPSGVGATGLPMSETRFAPVRQLTQLTPNEIQQVEDSIIEALIVSQALQRQRQHLRQRKAAENLAAVASQVKVTHVDKPRAQVSPKRQRSLRLRDALFARRRRRNSAQTKASVSDGQSKDLLQAASVPPGFIFNVSSLAPGSVILAAAPMSPMDYLRRPYLESINYGSQLDQTRLSLQPQAPIRVLLADQETNKPQLSASAHDQAAESSVTRLAMVSPLAEEFGKRVSASSQTSSRSQVRAVPLILVGSSPLSQVRSNPFAPTSSTQRSVDGQAERKAGSNRISVDWPAMLSDADYFPPATPESRGPRPSESRQVGHQRGGASMKPAAQWTPRQFSESQPKLQFSQDYQAREGVPLYNNNIRLVGVSSKRVTSSQLEPPRGARLAGDDEGANEDGGDESEDGELEQGASSKRSKKQVAPSVGLKPVGGRGSAR